MGIRKQTSFCKIEFHTICELRNVAWLEDGQLISLIFETFVCKSGWVAAVRGKTFTNKCMENEPISFNLGEHNLLPSIATLQFTNCVKFNSQKFPYPYTAL